MKFLCWDTSTKKGVVVLADISADGYSVIGSMSPDLEARYSEQLLVTVDQLLNDHQMTLNDIEGIGVGLGPGSFTGLRIGITTARTLAQIKSLPVVGVSSLALIAHSIDGVDGDVMILENAYRGEFFTLRGSASALEQFYGSPRNGVIEEVLTADEISEVLNGTSYRIEGAGASLYAQVAKRDLIAPQMAEITPDALARLVWMSSKEQDPGSFRDARPDYQRPSSAELNLGRK